MYRPLRLPPVRVLVVERNDYTRRVIREVLFTAGIRHLRVASDQVTAMTHLAAGYFDVAVVDWELATAGESLLLNALASTRDAAGHPVQLFAVMTGPTRATIDLVRSSGIRAAVMRPFSAASLVNRLNRMMRPDDALDDFEIRDAVT
jgi:AmiR/NasT family two-component response regulator